MKEYGENDGPLGRAPDIDVGASDAVLLAVSALGFCVLVWSVYSIVLAKLKTREELEREAEETEISYGEQLARVSDVSTLNRAQRRARAKHIMKQQRKLGGGGVGQGPLEGVDGDNNNNNNNNNELRLVQEGNPHEENIPVWDNHNHGHHANGQNLLSRKERQKAAKQVELQERKLLEEDRRNEQKKAQEAAVARRKAREARKKAEAEHERTERNKQKRARELARYRAWKIFVEARNPRHSITVKEWIRELQVTRVVFLDELAERFQLDESRIRGRIQELLDTNRLCGILETSHRDQDREGNNNENNIKNNSRPRFLYLSPNDMSQLASFVKAQDQFTHRDFAKYILQHQLPELSNYQTN